jgi:hypothetical protein
MKNLLFLFSIVIFSCGQSKEKINQNIQNKMAQELTNKYPNLTSLRSIKFGEIKEGENEGEITVWDNKNFEYVYSSKIFYKGADDFTWEILERKSTGLIFDIVNDYDKAKTITPIDLKADNAISGNFQIIGNLKVTPGGDGFILEDVTEKAIEVKIEPSSFSVEEKKNIINNCKTGCPIICNAKIVGLYARRAVVKISNIKSYDILIK